MATANGSVAGHFADTDCGAIVGGNASGRSVAASRRPQSAAKAGRQTAWLHTSHGCLLVDRGRASSLISAIPCRCKCTGNTRDEEWHVTAAHVGMLVAMADVVRCHATRCALQLAMPAMVVCCVGMPHRHG